MKRNGLLIFTLLGLIALEYGCRKDPVPPNISCDKNQDMAAVGIRDLYSYKETIGIRTEITEGETIAYDSFEIGIEIDTKHITQVANLNYGAYAIMAATSPLCWPLDSIQIEGISTSRSINLSSSFNVRSTYALDDTIPVTNDQAFKNRVPNFTHSAPLFLRFRMHKPPSILRLQRLRFTFHNSDGTVFQTSTTPFIISQ